MTEVLIAHGATSALFSFISAYINKGEQIVSFTPMFQLYYDECEMAGGVMKTVNLDYIEGNWTFDPKELRNALASGRTKVLILNNPHNPTGKIFTLEELQTISLILDDFPEVLVIGDEVYEFLTYDAKPHHFFAAIGDNWSRTVSIYSGGKLFSCTGWRIGWAIGPEALLRLGGIIQNAAVFNATTPCQVAMARSFDQLLLREQIES
jgi:aspartate/methionine/tyrosine aminotransferase